MNDLIAELERVRRSVASETAPDGPVHVVELRRTYDAPAEDVWDACTNPERIPRWFLPVSGDLRLGGRFQLEGNAGGEISECEPPRRLAVTWEFGGDASLVTLDLVPAGGGATELLLRHAVGDNDHWATYGPGATGVGWDLALLGLAQYVRTGALSARSRDLPNESRGRRVRATQRSGLGSGPRRGRNARRDRGRGRGSHERRLRAREHAVVARYGGQYRGRLTRHSVEERPTLRAERTAHHEPARANDPHRALHGAGRAGVGYRAAHDGAFLEAAAEIGVAAPGGPVERSVRPNVDRLEVLHAGEDPAEVAAFVGAALASHWEGQLQGEDQAPRRTDPEPGALETPHPSVALARGRTRRLSRRAAEASADGECEGEDRCGESSSNDRHMPTVRPHSRPHKTTKVESCAPENGLRSAVAILPVMHAAIHPLTPGGPAYAIAKLGAVGGLIALKVAMSRRARRQDDRTANRSRRPRAPYGRIL